MNEKEFVDQFAALLIKQAHRKAELYDGVQTAGRNRENAIDFFLRCATEEIGEVASAITRDRWMLAFCECVDLAHTALLIAFAIQLKHGVRNE